MKKITKNKIKLYDSGIFIAYISKEYALKNLESGFLEKINDYTYKTDMKKMGQEIILKGKDF